MLLDERYNTLGFFFPSMHLQQKFPFAKKKLPGGIGQGLGYLHLSRLSPPPSPVSEVRQNIWTCSLPSARVKKGERGACGGGREEEEEESERRESEPRSFCVPKGKGPREGGERNPKLGDENYSWAMGAIEAGKVPGGKNRGGGPRKSEREKVFSPSRMPERESKKNEQPFQFLHCAPSSFSPPPFGPGRNKPQSAPPNNSLATSHLASEGLFTC